MSKLVGKHVARIVNYGIAESKTGNPQVAVMFGFEVDGEPRELTWYGSLHPNAAEYTVDDLLNMGLKDDDLSILVHGYETQALDMNRDFEIVVAEEVYNGKSRVKIKYINQLGASKFAGMEPVKAETALKAMTGFVASRRQQAVSTGASIAQPTAALNAASSPKNPWE